LHVIFTVKTMPLNKIDNAKGAQVIFVRRLPFLHMIFLIALLFSSGCASRLKSSLASSLMKDMADATSKHDDIALVSQSAPTFLLLLEGLLEGDPDDRHLLIAAAEAYTSYATLIELDDPDRAKRLYARAKNYGLKALGQHRAIAPLLTAPYNEFTTLTNHLSPSDVKCVFWAASSWGAWISTNLESMNALAQLPKVIHLMEWVIEVDESFQFGSPHLFLGVYHAALPPMLGGNPEKAAYHFDRNIELTQGQALMAYVLKARYYARQIFDRELHDSLLKYVLSSPLGTTPELTLQNEIAKKMARQLLEDANDFF
jgi:hypothetical protein